MRRLATVLTGLLAFGCGDDGTPGQGTGEADATGTAGTTGPSGESSGEGTTAADGSSSDGADTTTGEPLLPVPGPSFYAFVDEQVTLDGSASTGAMLYQWAFDDGSPPTEPSAAPTADHVYATPGRYHPVLTVFDAAGGSLSASLTLTVTEVPSHAPRQAGTLVRLDQPDRFAVVSPDTDQVVFVEVTGEGSAFSIAAREPTCARPRTLAPLPDGTVAVTCQADDGIAIVGPGRAPVEVTLPWGTCPYGIVQGDDGLLYATLQGRGEVVQLDPAALVPLQTWPVIADARGLAVLPDGRLVVTRWRSPDAQAELAVLDPADGGVELVTLAFDPKEASDTEAGGIPSYLDQVLVSPIGDQAAVPSLQANIAQGEYLDGDPLTFESTLRGVVSWLDLPGRAGAAATEDFDRRKHFDNRGFMAAGVFSSRGDYLFVAARGSRAVERVDTFNGAQAGVLLDVGHAPAGLALTEDDRYLLVDASLSREVVVYDVSSFDVLPQPVAALPLVEAEPLPPAVLRGKQLFNDSFDPRLAKDSYIACAHCHLDGEADHRTWDFTDRGEGLRNTISLLGRGGTDHGPIHWSANFDEVQDFENDIRHAFEGAGLLDDADWNAGTTSQTLGDPKAGLSEDLDALAAYVASLTVFPRSPGREPDGSLGPQAQAGATLFGSPLLGCVDCHGGVRMTDSAFMAPGDPILHDVGTLTEASGQRLGGPLLGLDTPTLRGIWNDGPYLHDGSAQTLLEVLTTANPGDLHGNTSMLTTDQLDELLAFLTTLE